MPVADLDCLSRVEAFGVQYRQDDIKHLHNKLPPPLPARPSTQHPTNPTSGPMRMRRRSIFLRESNSPRRTQTRPGPPSFCLGSLGFLLSSVPGPRLFVFPSRG